MYGTAWQTERDALASWRARGTSVRTVSPSGSPVTLEFFKLHSRGPAAVAVDDLVALQYLEAATAWVEQYTGRALLEQTWTLTLDAPPVYGATAAILLPRVPVISVTSINSYSPADVATLMSAVTDYYVDKTSEPGRIVLRDGISWPSGLRVYNGLIVTYKAGYGTDSESVPVEFRQAICLLSSHWYENREAASDKKYEDIPFGVKAMVDTYRVAI